ncbi:MAG: ATP-binding protein, partial [Maribacter sp.]|nr:ATP-binding protein [Maribacter sp.]
SMSDYITKMLEHYECVAFDVDDTQYFDINEFLEELIDLLSIKSNCQINLPEESIEIHCNKIALQQIFLNLIVNSLKYNDKAETIIDIKAKRTDDLFEFKIRDNGRGIEKEKLKTIFELFATVGHLDNEGKKGHGIGLSTVQKIVGSLGGTISVSSKLGSYSEFTFTIADV